MISSYLQHVVQELCIPENGSPPSSFQLAADIWTAAHEYFLKSEKFPCCLWLECISSMSCWLPFKCCQRCTIFLCFKKTFRWWITWIATCLKYFKEDSSVGLSTKTTIHSIFSAGTSLWACVNGIYSCCRHIYAANFVRQLSKIPSKIPPFI